MPQARSPALPSAGASPLTALRPPGFRYWPAFVQSRRRKALGLLLRAAPLASSPRRADLRLPSSLRRAVPAGTTSATAGASPPYAPLFSRRPCAPPPPATAIRRPRDSPTAKDHHAVASP